MVGAGVQTGCFTFTAERKRVHGGAGQAVRGSEPCYTQAAHWSPEWAVEVCTRQRAGECSPQTIAPGQHQPRPVGAYSPSTGSLWNGGAEMSGERTGDWPRPPRGSPHKGRQSSKRKT